jgi:DNA-binding response OmpR family regulator
MAQDRNEITKAGFDGFLSKPINLKEFLESISARLTLGGKARRRRPRYW